MDPKFVNLFYFIFFTDILRCSTKKINDVEFLGKDQSCNIHLSACELNIGEWEASGVQGLKGDKGDRGENGINGANGLTGEKGEHGINGTNGEKGEKGDRGENGINGLMGEKGEQGINGTNGEKGEKGDRGGNGINGANGFTGEKGEQGINGKNGEKGEKGDRGLGGEKGEQGKPGVNGTKGEQGRKGEKGDCGCKATYERESDSQNTVGDETNPANHICNSDDMSEGTFWVNPSDPFQIECKRKDEKQLTCLPLNATAGKYSGVLSITLKSYTSFWLSHTLLDSFKTLYNINMLQMNWLREKAKTVTQTFRFHCRNFPLTTSPEDSLQMLSWNDVLIGSQSSNHTPTAYAFNTDHECVDGAPKTDWMYSDLNVKGSSFRLPIIDFYITNNKGEEESKFFIKLIELCFET